MNRAFIRNHALRGCLSVNRRNLGLLAVAGFSIALNACTITGGASGIGPGMKATLSPRSLSFANLAVGTTSTPQTVVLTDAGNATLIITSITVTGNFSQTNDCGASLAPGASCTLTVTFTPTATGPESGSILVADNAIGSPQAIELEGASGGTGTGGAELCTGSSLPQTQTDVTSQLSYVNTAAGVDVMQLTSNGCNRFYYFDVPAYSSTTNKIVYDNFVPGAGNNVLWANPDGTSAAVLAAGSGNQDFVSGDGTLVYYDKPVESGTPDTSDIFGRLVASPTSEIRITDLQMAPLAPLPVWEISSASPDPAGGQDIAFSPDTLVHLVHVLANGTVAQPLPTPITLDDPENSATFHRLRLNPKFPNIVMYKRNASSSQTGATPELWLVDLNTCANNTCPASSIINVVANLQGDPNSTPEAGHINWSPDGLDIAFSEPDIADYWLARNVVNADGTINQGFTLQNLGPFSGMTADYCVFPPDWPASTILACIAGAASPANAKTFYLMSSDGTGTTKLLASSDAQVLDISGTPMPRFAQDDVHILFNSDKTGGVQVYLISGFTLSVP
jgi:hypothetical protein